MLTLRGRLAPSAEQWPHRIDRCLLEAQGEVDGRGLSVSRSRSRSVEQTIDVHRAWVANDDLVAEAVERSTRHDDHLCDRRVLLALVFRLARGDSDVETAHESPSVQQPVVQVRLLTVIALLSAEVERAECLSVEVAQPSELRDGAAAVVAGAGSARARSVRAGLGLMRVRPRVRDTSGGACAAGGASSGAAGARRASGRSRLGSRIRGEESRTWRSLRSVPGVDGGGHGEAADECEPTGAPRRDGPRDGRSRLDRRPRARGR